MKPLFPKDKDYTEVKGYQEIRVYKDLTHRKEKPVRGDYYYLTDGTKYVCLKNGVWSKKD